MQLETLPMGLALVRRSVHADTRGIFERLFSPDELTAWSDFTVRQVNHTRTSLVGAARGLHAQSGATPETKIVTCIRGSVFDVAVDIRPDSPTCGQWHGVELSADSGTSFVIPPGFAHGFQVLEENSELLYVHNAPYDRPSEVRLSLLDPDVQISWPLAIGDISDADRTAPDLSEAVETYRASL